MVERVRLLNRNQLNSPQTEQTLTPADSRCKLKQILTTFTKYSNGIFINGILFFFTEIIPARFFFITGPFPTAATATQSHQSVYNQHDFML